MEKILVTGANGFIGQHLVNTLLNQGFSVIALVEKSLHLNIFENNEKASLEVYVFDIKNIDSHLKNATIVFHLIGHLSGNNQELYYQTNLVITSKILKIAKTMPSIRQFNYVSTQAVVGPYMQDVDESTLAMPISMYGITKLLAEYETLKYCSHFRVSIFRPSSVYGPGDKQFFDLFKMIKRGYVPKINYGKNEIQLIYIQDLVDVMISSIEKNYDTGNIFFLTNSEIYTWNHIIQEIKQVQGKEKIAEFNLPYCIAKSIGSINHFVEYITHKPRILSKDKIKEMMHPRWVCKNQKSIDILSFKANVDLSQGLDYTYAWYTKNKML